MSRCRDEGDDEMKGLKFLLLIGVILLARRARREPDLTKISDDKKKIVTDKDLKDIEVSELDPLNRTFKKKRYK